MIAVFSAGFLFLGGVCILTFPRACLEIVKTPKSGSFPAVLRHFFLESIQDSCGKMPCLTKKSLAFRHSAYFQTRPSLLPLFCGYFCAGLGALVLLVELIRYYYPIVKTWLLFQEINSDVKEAYHDVQKTWSGFGVPEDGEEEPNEKPQ